MPYCGTRRFPVLKGCNTTRGRGGGGGALIIRSYFRLGFPQESKKRSRRASPREEGISYTKVFQEGTRIGEKEIG